MIITSQGRPIVLNSSPIAEAYRSTSHRPGQGLLSLAGLNRFATYAALYRSQPWLWRVVNQLARGIARLPLRSYRDNGTDNPDPLHKEGIDAVLRRPYTKGSRFSLIEATVGNVALYGNELWVIARPGPGRPPSQFWPLAWPYIEVIGRGLEPEGFVFHAPSGERVPFDPDEVVHFRWWGPSSTGEMVAPSPVEPLRRTLFNEDAAQRWTSATFQNAGQPSAIVTGPDKISRADRRIVKTELQELYGGVDNAGRIALLDRGLDWKAVASSAHDTELVNLRKLNREEVVAVYQIDPTMAGILDHGTYSNVSEAHRREYMDTYGQWLSMIEDTILTQIIFTEPAWEDQFSAFDMGEVLRGSLKERAEAYRVLRYIYTTNELRKLENLPRHDDPSADEIRVPAGEAFLGAEGQNGEMSLIVSNALNKVERSAASRVGAGQNGFDRGRFLSDNQELGEKAETVADWIEQAIEGCETAADVHDAFARLKARVIEGGE